MSYLIDTNILIYHFGNRIDDESVRSLFLEHFNISIITKIEFLGWKKFLADAASYDNAKKFISHATVFDLSEAIADQTIQFRQQFKIKTPDAIIAATALVNGLTVVTNNTEDFSQVGVPSISVKLK